MELEMILEGASFGVYALSWQRGGFSYCQAQEFMDRMSEASEKSMLNVIRRHVAAGPVFNEQKSRLLEDGIYEFKSRQGDRLAYFYHPAQRGQTIVTHGFSKGARLRTEIDRAIALRRAYLQSIGWL